MTASVFQIKKLMQGIAYVQQRGSFDVQYDQALSSSKQT